ncbi:MAG TPA: hypothetical protein PKN96_04140 [Flavobacterium sp.]|uniref:hypothetical protein n=1 Tax=Flavobacterium sp. TaxID=239 RepID=UPI002D00E758|nr:hypothetical protein [Flavobacterium sp.]HNP32457.1 hypothetical protein [Flavobacterium sp.]
MFTGFASRIHQSSALEKQDLLRNIHQSSALEKQDFASQYPSKLRFEKQDFASQYPSKLRFEKTGFCFAIFIKAPLWKNRILLRNIHQSSALKIKSTKKRSSKLGVFSHDFIYS